MLMPLRRAEINLTLKILWMKKKGFINSEKILNARKQAYWIAIRFENLADVYKKWRQNEEVILFRKFRQKPIHNQPEEKT